MKRVDIITALRAETALMTHRAVQLDQLEHYSPEDLKRAEASAKKQRGEMTAAIARMRAQLNQLEALL